MTTYQLLSCESDTEAPVLGWVWYQQSQTFFTGGWDIRFQGIGIETETETDFSMQLVAKPRLLKWEAL